MNQIWYKKATVQSAIVNAIPNLVIAGIAVTSLIITYQIYKHQEAQTQRNFAIQIKRDSLQTIRQDSVTKQNLRLAELQLKIINKQFTNDSLNKASELKISKNELAIIEKQNDEADMQTKENLYINKISFLTYETKYQRGFADSVFGYEPDKIYKSTENITSNRFVLLERLVLYDPKADSVVAGLPILQTVTEAKQYFSHKKIDPKFGISKMYTIVIDITNNTKFPIKILSTKNSTLTFKNLSNLPEKTQQIDNSLIIYPGEKSKAKQSLIASLDVTLNTEFILNLRLEYKTIYGIRTKEVKAIFSPDNKDFTFYD